MQAYDSDSDDDAPVIPEPPAPVTTGDGQTNTSTRMANGQVVDEPPRKRQRTNELGSNSEFQVGSSYWRMSQDTTGLKLAWGMDEVEEQNAQSLVKDEKYYISEADCVIRVEDTLFKVHRFLLARDSSAFQDMFSMPHDRGGQDPDALEGYSDKRPIVVFGETARNFRTLLSVMYALPSELHQYTTPLASVPTLLTIAQTTNKYHFTSTESWAISALWSVLTSYPSPPPHYDLQTCRPSLIRRVVEVAMLCQHERLWGYAVQKWVQRILAREVSPLGAMEVADRFALMNLKGVSYYVMLMECGERMEWDASKFKDDEDDEEEYADDHAESEGANSSKRSGSQLKSSSSLTAEQKSCLLSGAFSLANYWDRIRTRAPTFTRPEGCTYHAHGCLSTWNTIWQSTAKTEQTVKFRTMDVVGRLRSMEDQLALDADLQCALTPGCRRAAMLSLKRLVKDVQDGLAGHFVDLTREPRGEAEG